MDMNDKDFELIDKALKEYSEHGKITEKCQKCGKELIFIQTESSYEIRCKNGCISESFRGI